jgi:hypothetical protein
MVDVGDPHAYFAALFDSLANVEAPARTGDVELIYWWHTRVHATLNGRPGSAIAQVAFLPHLVDIGVTDLVLLPVASVGLTARKGSNGSPFAVSDPFDVDGSLDDPLLVGLTALDQYRAFVHCCHQLGIRVASHVPLATLAVDSRLFARFPQLGYWWTAPPGVPLTPSATSTYPPVAPPLPEWASRRFREAPAAVAVDHGRLLGVTDDETVTLANAIPDVVAGDAVTYTWADSAAVRYGDAVVPPPMGVASNSGPLCPDAVTVMAATLAFRWADLGEDGAVIDVSPNVPDAVLAAAEELAANWSTSMSATVREVLDGSKPSAALIEALGAALAGERSPAEHWLLAEELWRAEVPNARYDAVTGPFAYSVGASARHPTSAIQGLLSLVRACMSSHGNFGMAGATALHDTLSPPPAVGLVLTAVAAALPGAIPTVYAGVEHGSSHLTNGEFGFSDDVRLAAYRRWVGVTGLSLFEAHVHDWTGCDAATFDAYQRLLPAVLQLRREIGPSSILAVDQPTSTCLQLSTEGKGGRVDVTVNLDPTQWFRSVPTRATRTLVVAGRCFDGHRLTPVFEEVDGSAPADVAPTSAHLAVVPRTRAGAPRRSL